MLEETNLTTTNSSSVECVTHDAPFNNSCSVPLPALHNSCKCIPTAPEPSRTRALQS